MAKTQTAQEFEEQSAQEFEEQTAQEPAKQDRMQKMVDIYVPRMPGEDPNMWVALNGKRYLIPCGKTSKLPEPVAKQVQDALDARERAFRFTEKLKETDNTMLTSL